jgi:formiminotetrahydrofolate cyclodeaminase
MKLTERTVHDLLGAFRSSEPTPGGGSASALTGAVGSSLLAMVAALPKPAAADAAELQQLQAAGARCTELAQQLESLVDRDSDAYDLVVSAYRLPKATEEEKRARAERIQQALRAAIDAPLDVMRACAAAAEQAPVIAQLGNRNASSDVQVAVELLRAGLAGARLNVEINLGSVRDEAYARAVREEVQRCELPNPNSQLPK